jgi:hypothetical protein
LPGDIFSELRRAINDSVKLRNEIYQKKDGSWDRLWAAMDALEDAQVAIDDFQKAKSISYLQIYGLLQAFVVQQDSVDLIRQTVIGSLRIDWKKGGEPKLGSIRELRNETAGHPADVRTSTGTVYCNIDRSSISKISFKYIIWNQSGAHSKEAKLNDVIKIQEAEILRLTKDTAKMIKANDEDFIKQFTGEKLKDTYEQVSHYQFEKLYLHENNLDYAKSMFGSIEKVYAQLKSGLEKRYGSFESTINVPGLKLSTDELDELILRISEKFEKDVPDSFDFTVYIESLESKWKELGEMVDETDNRFTS